MGEGGPDLAGATAVGLADLLRGYHVPVGHYDELREAPSRPRLHWAHFGDQAGALDSRELSRAE